MQLTDLNDDVLAQVFSLLHGRDALSTALSARRLHSLAIIRVPAVVECADYRAIPRLRSYMVGTSPPRAQRLSHLKVDLPGFRSLAELTAVAAPLAEVLMQAPNIRVLCLHGFFITKLDTECCVTLSKAIGAMSRLRELSITHLHDTVLSLLCASLPAVLRKLSLSFIAEWDAWRHSSPPLLEVLTSLPVLNTLHVHGFKPRAGLGDTSLTLPSLRNVTLFDVSLPAVDIVSLAPNLQHVSVSYEHLKPTQWHPSIEPWTERPRPWPPVRRLEFNAMSSLSHFLDAFSAPTDYLEITARTSLSRAGDLKSALRVLSPVGADLYLTVGEDPAMFWREVADVAPRLRYLRLSLTVKIRNHSYTRWLGELATSLSAIPLVYLRIRPHLKLYKTALKGVSQKAKHKSKPEDMQQEITRKVLLETSARLPQVLATAIPTLRFFELGVWEGDEPTQNVPYARCEDADSSRWWRIDSGQPQEMSAGEGQRVLDFVENADAEEMLDVQNLIQHVQ